MRSKFFQGGAVRVKICGITTPEDAKMVAEAGADAIGFNFYTGSKRFVDPVYSLPWIRDLADTVDRVAVVVNPDPKLLRLLREADCFEAIQFHGDELPDFCAESGFSQWIRAIRVRDATSLRDACDDRAAAVLLDAWSQAGYGGTGSRVDWDLVACFVRQNPEKKVILAGGLDVHNVRMAARIVCPHAVDVASGVEIGPGKKDEYLLREFIAAVRNSGNTHRHSSE